MIKGVYPTRNELAELYEKMFAAIKSEGCKSEKQYTAAMYLTGEHYFEQPDHQKILVIGRALNGWSLPCDFLLSSIESTFDLAGQYIAEWNKMDDPTADVSWPERELSHEECHHLKWVNTYKNGKKTSNTGFWRLAKISARKTGNLNDDLWIDQIAWTNLYKVSPNKKGNPQGRCQKAQERTCVEILEKEIELLNPSHIFVIALTNKKDGGITGEWVQPFIHVLESAEKENRRILYFPRPEFKSGKNIYTPYVCRYDTQTFERLKEGN